MYIFSARALASCRWRPLSSNVRPRNPAFWAIIRSRTAINSLKSMYRRHLLLLAPLIAMTGCASSPALPTQDVLIQEVTATEIAFAKTMTDRDHAAFMSFIAEDAVFLNGGKPLRGKAAIGDYWRRFYSSSSPPFTWKPDLVVINATGALAQSVGPVAMPNGKVFSRFYSTWRREPDGRWRVVFDDGYDVCDCNTKP